MKKTLADFQPLKPAEQKLLECCQVGKMAIIGKDRPIKKTEDNEIRAEFIRWLILTNEVEIDSYGIQLRGAWISSVLDLSHCSCSSVIAYFASVFEETLFLMRATTKTIYADGSWFQKGISADGLICHGSLHFRNGFRSEGEICFIGAKVEGNFDCENGVFQVINEEKYTLLYSGMDISGELFLRGNCKILSGIVDLTNATVGSLVDDTDFWAQKSLKKVKLDGFKYRHIYGNTSASFRLEQMLGKMSRFKPQPYKQLAKVLREMGHDRDADEVMITLHDKRLETTNESWFYQAFRKLYKWTSEYGYRPMRTLKIMTSVWFLFGSIYWYGANVAVFAPTNPLIFQKDYNCTIDKNGTQWLAFPKDYNESNNWYIASPAEYTTFQPFWYSLDIILPVVDLKMENDWGIVIPSPEGNWSDMIPFTTTNHFIRFLTWVETLAGWGLSLMLVAILSGLAKNEKE